MASVIKKPLLTEKNTSHADLNIFAFEVDRKATKTDIKAEVEKRFRVKVSEVRTAVCRGRARRTKLGLSKVKYWKKALVKLAPGEKITLFEGV